jgi:hypothetical protein
MRYQGYLLNQFSYFSEWVETSWTIFEVIPFMLILSFKKKISRGDGFVFTRSIWAMRTNTYGTIWDRFTRLANDPRFTLFAKSVKPLYQVQWLKWSWEVQWYTVPIDKYVTAYLISQKNKIKFRHPSLLSLLF